MKKEVNNVRRKRKLNFQKIFNLVSATFILACCIFYGTRFIKLYIEILILVIRFYIKSVYYKKVQVPNIPAVTALLVSETDK